MEYNLKRILDVFLIVTALFNGLFLILFVFYLLIGWEVIPYRFLFLVKPIEILSKNLLLILLIFVIQILLLLYYFFNFKKRVKLDVSRDEGAIIDSSDLFEPYDDQLIYENNESEENFIPSSETKKTLPLAEDIARKNRSVPLFPVGSPLKIKKKRHKNKGIALSAIDNSPSFYSGSNQKSSSSILLKSDKSTTGGLGFPRGRDPRLSLNDSQFAFYQRLLKEKWIYENSQDRERIKLDHYAIDEVNLPLSQINTLINKKMLYRRVMPHPSGSFVIYSTKKGIEKDFIYEMIEKMMKERSYKLINRKIEFPDWENLDLVKKTWSFDFEIAPVQIIGSIWVKKLFRKSEMRKIGYTFTEKKREELKALIATILMKFNRKGQILLITNYEKNAEKIINLCKEISQVKIKVLFLSDQHFEDQFYSLLNFY